MLVIKDMFWISWSGFGACKMQRNWNWENDSNAMNYDLNLSDYIHVFLL